MTMGGSRIASTVGIVGEIMIYRFTNVRGRQNYGVVAELVANGANVLMDCFEPKPGVTLPARFCYVSFERNPFVMGETQSEVLPADTPVNWQTPLVAEAHKAVKAGEGAQWFVEHAADVWALSKKYE